MKPLPNTVLTLIPSDKIPEWITGAPARHIQQIIQLACVSAGVSGQARLRYLSEKDVLKKKNLPASSLVIQNSSRYYGVDTLALICTGKDARNHKVRCTLTMASAACEQLAQYITTLPEHTFVLNTFRNPVLPPGLPLQAPAQGTIRNSQNEGPAVSTILDDDALAIYLSGIRDLGGIVTQFTADALAKQSTGSTEIIHAVFTHGYLQWDTKGFLTLTAEGLALVDRVLSPKNDATKPKDQPAPSELDRLKAAVRDARAQHQATKTAHDDRAQALTTLTHQLTEAREAYQSEELNATTLQGRLQKLQQDLTSAQCKVIGARRHVLDLEEQARALGTDTPDLIQAERTLKEAEAAYAQLIAL